MASCAGHPRRPQLVEVQFLPCVPWSATPARKALSATPVRKPARAAALSRRLLAPVCESGKGHPVVPSLESLPSGFQVNFLR